MSSTLLLCFKGFAPLFEMLCLNINMAARAKAGSANSILHCCASGNNFSQLVTSQVLLLEPSRPPMQRVLKLV